MRVVECGWPSKYIKSNGKDLWYEYMWCVEKQHSVLWLYHDFFFLHHNLVLLRNYWTMNRFSLYFFFVYKIFAPIVLKYGGGIQFIKEKKRKTMHRIFWLCSLGNNILFRSKIIRLNALTTTLSISLYYTRYMKYNKL